MLHVHMFATATKFNLTDLTDEARKAFAKVLSKKEVQCINRYPNLLDIAHAVYESVPVEETALKDILLNTLFSAEFDCRSCPSSGDHAKLFDVLHEIPDLMADFAMCQQHTFSCLECKRVSRCVVRPCQCKKFRGLCDKEVCLLVYEANGQCEKCHRINCLDFGWSGSD